MKKILAIIILFSISMMTFTQNALTNELQRLCVDYIRNYGGPCMHGPGNSKTFKGRLASGHHTFNGFILGIDSFPKAIEIFGDAKLWHTGDAASSEDKICYTSQDQDKRNTIVFAAGSEMSKNFVDSVRMIQGDINFSSQCANTAIKASNIKTDSGIYLGMPLLEFKKIMGEPSANINDFLFYTYCEKKSTEPGETWCVDEEGKSMAERCSGGVAHFAQGKLVWFSFSAGNDYYC